MLVSFWPLSSLREPSQLLVTPCGYLHQGTLRNARSSIHWDFLSNYMILHSLA